MPACDRRTDGQADKPPIDKSRTIIIERDTSWNCGELWFKLKPSEPFASRIVLALSKLARTCISSHRRRRTSDKVERTAVQGDDLGAILSRTRVCANTRSNYICPLCQLDVVSTDSHVR